MTQCVILAGGADTLPEAVSGDPARPRRDAAGRPLLDHLIEELARFGIDDFLVIVAGSATLSATLSIVGDRAKRQGRDGRPLTVTTFELESCGAAGGLSRFSDRLCDAFLLINGDTFFDCNITGLVRPALAPDRMMRLAVCREASPPSSAMVELDGDRVVRIGEKVQRSGSGWTSAGVCYVRKEVISFIEGVPCSLELDILPRLLGMQAIEARRFEGKLIDIGVAGGSGRARQCFPIWRGAVFFDRDGVLNEDSGYVHRPHELRWIAGARECVRAVNDSGRFAFVVTNQSGVARGFYDEDAVCAFHAEMQRQLLAVGAHIDAFVFCPHHPDGVLLDYARSCDCRKPMPGMIRQLLSRWPVRRQDSILIGDRPSDLLAAEAAGIAGRLYGGSDLRQML